MVCSSHYVIFHTDNDLFGCVRKDGTTAFGDVKFGEVCCVFFDTFKFCVHQWHVIGLSWF